MTTVIDLSVERSVMLNLGRVGENNINDFVFVYSNWAEEFGEGTLTLVLKRQGDDEGYPKSMTTADNQSTWLVDSTDVANEGIGEAQLTYTVEEEIKKSVIYLTRTCPSIEPVGPAPDPYQSWLDQMIEAKEDAENAAERAETAAENLDTKGYYPDMHVGTADNLLSDSYTVTNDPYLIKPSSGARIEDTLVGGTVVWNQLCNSASVTVQNGHKYLLKKGSAWSVGASTGTAITGLTSGSDIVVDLTLFFNPTIADYLYTVEQSTAGAGVALAKKWAGIKGYIPYDAGTLKSVSNVSAHVMRDADDVVRATYPLDSSLTLRGITKLVNNQLVYDGDTYESDGTVNRRYGIVDLGSLTWSFQGTTTSVFYASVENMFIPTTSTGRKEGIMSSKYAPSATTSVGSGADDKSMLRYGGSIYIRDTSYADAPTFKTAMNGVYLIYELATPTTETAEPYAPLQTVYDGGTEEYVTDSIPVGHNTKVHEDLKKKIEGIPPLPTANGSYHLKATVSNGKVTYEWSTT